jgi:hypothetical protein
VEKKGWSFEKLFETHAYGGSRKLQTCHNFKLFRPPALGDLNSAHQKVSSEGIEKHQQQLSHSFPTLDQMTRVEHTTPSSIHRQYLHPMM